MQMASPIATAHPQDGMSQAALLSGWAECWRILRENGKTFHMMARVLGSERGNAIAALYGFARVADDLVDEPAPGDTPAGIRDRLRWMQQELRRAVAGESREPRFAALGETVRRYRIPLQPFHDLLTGVAMDLEPTPYETFADLELLLLPGGGHRRPHDHARGGLPRRQPRARAREDARHGHAAHQHPARRRRGPGPRAPLPAARGPCRASA